MVNSKVKPIYKTLDYCDVVSQLTNKPITNNHLLFAGLVMYGLAAWCSEGYHHPDEHFQLLELANYKLGNTPATDLPWEFAEHIRPGLQPWLAYETISGLKVIGVESPFNQAFLLRLLSGWLMWLVIFVWSKQLGRNFDEERLVKNLLWSAMLLWFIPYLSVRFSSENWAGMSFLAGLFFVTQFLDNERNRVGWRLVLGGLLLGLSFFFRFQMAFALAGVAVWLLYYRRLRGVEWGWLLLGGGLAIGIGVWADYWLYGTWEFTAWHYFQANILENKAINWGTAPWWFYLQEIVLTGLPPVSLLLLGLAIWGGFKHKKHVLVWALLPFFLAHTLVAHKELRFLFPMVFPFIALAVIAWQTTWEHFKNYSWAKAVIGLAVIINFIALPIRSLTPANEALPCFRFLYHYAQNRPITLFAMEKNPYQLVGLTAHFYQPENLKVIVLSQLEQLDSMSLLSNNLLIYPALQLPPTLIHTNPKRLYSYFPNWITALNINDWQSRSRIWSIYQVERKR